MKDVKVFTVFKKMRSLSRMLTSSAILILGSFALSACNISTVSESSGTSSTSVSQRFASGTKGVKIITSTTAFTGSFTTPANTPTPTPIPTGYPGADGSTLYLPGVSPSTYFAVDGTTSISKPSWLIDFQMGITKVNSSSTCAAFGTLGSQLDPSNYYRVSEADCGSVSNGTGSGADPVFMRIVLDRDNSVLGSAENLLVQVEYEAAGIHLNSDGTQTAAEDNLDQLWKIFWNSSLGAVTAKTFGLFIPPNYSACIPAGTGNAGALTNANKCDLGLNPTYQGAPVKVRQFVIPLSAYPDLKVIQISRVKSRKTTTVADDYPAGDDYVSDFCATNTPRCLGVVIHSVTILRM